jgi:hypothetical protein
MPALVAWLFSALGGLTAFYASTYGMRVGVGLAVVVLTAAVYATFFVAVHSLLAAVQFSLPADMAIALTWFLPPNLRECISMRISVEVLSWVVYWKHHIAGTVLKAT